MKGLILKDFINLKKNAKIFGVVTVLYAVIAVFSGDTNFFSSLFTVMIAFLTISLYSYDEMAKWDSFALTMPVTKDDLVQGKYIMMLLLTLIGVIYGSVFTAVINVAVKANSIFYGFASIGAGAAIIILFYSITIPFITKLGVEKARLLFFAVYIIPFIVIMAVNNLVKDGLVMPENLMNTLKFLIKYVYIIVPLVDAIALGISYRISVNIFRKKEF